MAGTPERYFRLMGERVTNRTSEHRDRPFGSVRLLI